MSVIAGGWKRSAWKVAKAVRSLEKDEDHARPCNFGIFSSLVNGHFHEPLSRLGSSFP